MTRYSAVLLREGAFKGVSPPKPIRFSRAVLAKHAPTMEGKPLKLNHDGAGAKIAGAPVGVVRNVRFNADSVVAVLELDPKVEHFATARAFIESQLALGVMPNVSIEATFIGKDTGAELVVDELSFTALALVGRGACNDLHGCGVVAALSQGVSTMDTTNTNTTAGATEPVQPTAATGTVTFTVVPEQAAEPAKAEARPCGCAEAEAKLAALPSLEARLAEATKATDSLKVELAKATAELAAEKARVPLLVELAAVLPGFKTDGKSVAELSAALEAAQAARLAPKLDGPARRSLLAEPTPTKTPKELLAEAMQRY